VIIQVIMVGILIVFPQMSLVYKSGVPDVDPSKVKIEIPEEAPDKSDDILKDLQKSETPDKGAAPAVPDKGKSPEDKAADDIEKALKGGK
jgi:hypothetical protein